MKIFVLKPLGVGNEITDAKCSFSGTLFDLKHS